MSVSYYHTSSCSSTDNVSYYCPQKQADSNHSVTLIGWDDNYSKENFTTQPPEDGAWLCKNQLGKSSEMTAVSTSPTLTLMFSGLSLSRWNQLIITILFTRLTATIPSILQAEIALHSYLCQGKCLYCTQK